MSRQALNGVLSGLGLVLTRGKSDPTGRRWAYRTSGIHGGPLNYFDDLPAVARHAGRVQQIRDWQSNPID